MLGPSLSIFQLKATTGGGGAGNYAPLNTVLPVASIPTPQPPNIASVTNGTWDALPPTGLTYTYQWRADGVNIGGATSQTYVTTNTEVGKVLSCAVTASNIVGASSPAISNNIGPITAAPLFGVGSAGSTLLGDTEPSGLAVDFLTATPNMLVRDPAATLNYSGLPFTVDGGKFTLNRASVATRINPSGFIESVASGIPRIEHVLGTGVRRGVLLEESRVNIVLWCSDLTNAVWVKTNITTAQTATGPDNAANSATTITASAANGTCLQTITNASVNRWQSSYVKRVTGSGGVDMTMDGGTTWVAITLTGAWARVNIPNQTVLNPVVGFRLATSGDAISVYGVQNESVSAGGAPTSLIQTTTATVTRATENITMATSLIPFADGAPGSMVFEFTTLDISVANASLVAFRSAATNIINMFISGGTPNYNVFAATVGQCSEPMGSAMAAGQSSKIAAAWATNDFKGCRDTVLTTGDTVGTLPSGTTPLEFRGSGHSVPAKAYIISKFTYIPRRITNAEMQTRTT